MLDSSRTHLTFGSRYRWVAAAGLAVALAASSGAALAQTVGTPSADCSTLHFDLANPNAGDVLLPGGYMVEGFAFDAAATSTQGTGVDRVDFFLNDRDAGGLSLGTATLGQATSAAVPGTAFANAGFSLELTLPVQSGGETLFAYAHSTVTDQEQILSVPIQIGEDTSAQPMPGAPVATTGRPTCAAAVSPTQTGLPVATTLPQPTAQPTAQATPLMPQPAATVAPASLANALHIALDNPQAGDNLLPGEYVITGTALDTRATSGSGIDRVAFFLGDRDLGGLFLGETTAQAADAAGLPIGRFSIVVDLTEHNAGATLFAYAHSSVTGDETLVSIPVIVGDITD